MTGASVKAVMPRPTPTEERDLSDSEYVQIQVDMSGHGNWQTVSSTIQDAQYVAHQMKSVANMNPEKRVRAVDSSGRLIDLL